MKMIAKLFAAVLLCGFSLNALAVTCSGTANWGSMGPPGSREFGNSFSTRGTYLDCYRFTLATSGDGFGGVVEIDPWLNLLDIDVTKVSLYSGGLSGSNTTGSLIAWDDSPGKFSFLSLVSGAYVLAISTTVSRDLGLFTDPVSYKGKIETTSATSVPEPTSLAMLALGLIGLGLSRRWRRIS